DLSNFTAKQTESGGNQATFILSTDGIPQYVLKKGDDRIEQFKEEVLSDAIYDVIGKAEESFGIRVPAFSVIVENGQFKRISQFSKGEELGLRHEAEVANGFIVDAFMANWDLVVGGGKNLWLSDGQIYRMDNGGSLRYRAMGELKATLGYDFSDARCDIDTLRGIACENNTPSTDGAKFYGHLSEQDILAQIEKLMPLKDKVLAVADQYHAKLHFQNYAALRSNLITRFESLASYYYDHPQVVEYYQRAHPFRMIIPGQQSSASVLIYAMHEGRPKILLGKRVGHNWWGNFGGKADDGDTTLLSAAVREVTEESMGEYVFLKEELLMAPSHDLIKNSTGPDRLHRMYLVQADYKDPKAFTDKLALQTDAHSKEYTDFQWVDAQDLLTLAQRHGATANSTGDENQYKMGDVFIFHPLMDMLRQEPVLNWLKAVVSDKPVRLLNTAGSIGIPTHTGQYPAPPFLDPRAERLQKRHHGTTKHMNVLTELKEKQALKARLEAAKQGKAEGPSSGDPQTLPETTATDAYLAFTLGDAFIPKDDQANIHQFLRDHSTLATGYAHEFAPDTPTCGEQASYKCTLLKVMDHERKMHNWFVLYHTLPGKLAFMYDIFTEFRNVLRLKGSDTMHSLRAFDKFFKKLQTVEDFIADELQKQNQVDFTNMNNYAGTFQEKGLSTNIFLFGNPNVDTSSTFHMLYDDKTVSPPNYELLLRALLSEFGITDTQKYF
ncbi:MAG: NUDIX hydrolase, partial [Alphaproteobacteria bacterium]|nr:NUDIX hydrolase [Alphaproteobacteria bacterium]